MYNNGRIFNIQRFSTSDGPGIRTVVFMKGCPLNCAWCHNPESKSTETEILYRQNKFDDCGSCAEVCGEEKTAEEIIDIVLRDVPFYEESGGGITLSGGEPLMQYEFSMYLLKLAKENGLHTAVETSGFSTKDLAPLNEYVDFWLYDIKLFSEEEHIRYTGVTNKIIWDNLYLLNHIGAQIILRCPIIPDINMSYEHFENLARLANTLNCVTAIHLEPYHPLGLSKAQQLGKKQAYANDRFLESSALAPFVSVLQAKTNKEIIII